MNFKTLKELWRSLSQVVDHDFAKVRDYLVLSKDDVAEQHDGPYVGQVILERKSADVINLDVSVWIHHADGSYTKFYKKQDFYSLANVPEFVQSELDLTRRYEVVLRPSELNTMCSERNMKIHTRISDLPNHIKHSIKKSGYGTGSVIAEISGTGLYYRIKVCPSGSNSPILTLLTTSVEGLNYQDANTLRTVHMLNLQIDIL